VRLGQPTSSPHASSAHHVLHQRRAVKVAAVLEELVKQLLLADLRLFKLDPCGGVLGGQQLVEGEGEEARHVLKEGVLDDGVLAGGGGWVSAGGWLGWGSEGTEAWRKEGAAAGGLGTAAKAPTAAWWLALRSARPRTT